jgi:hypothetical protein
MPGALAFSRNCAISTPVLGRFGLQIFSTGIGNATIVASHRPQPLPSAIGDLLLSASDALRVAKLRGELQRVAV